MNVAQVTARQPVTAGRTTGRVNQLLVVAVAMAAAVGVHGLVVPLAGWSACGHRRR